MTFPTVDDAIRECERLATHPNQIRQCAPEFFVTLAQMLREGTGSTDPTPWERVGPGFDTTREAYENMPTAQPWKPTGDPVRDLVKAGALIAAAIDSLTAQTIRTEGEAP